MEKIVAYKLTNGSIVLDEKEAKKLQKEIDIKSKIAELYEKYSDSSLLLYEIIDDIYTNRKEIIDALGG